MQRFSIITNCLSIKITFAPMKDLTVIDFSYPDLSLSVKTANPF